MIPRARAGVAGLLACAALASPAAPAPASSPTGTSGTQRAAAPAPGHAPAAGETVTLPVSPGDTLLAIAQQRLEPPYGWRSLARLNNVADPTRLVPGSTLTVPLAWLKSRPAQAVVESVNGTTTGSDGRPLVAGQRLEQDALVQTGADAVVVLRLGDGSTLRIAPASRLRIERLRSYHRDDVIDARIALERGRVEAQAASPRQRPMQIRSPFATAAVRGTVFRVGAAEQLATSEVIEGGVDWGGARGNVALGAGFGSVADPSGRVTAPERLLDPPALGGLPAQVNRPVSSISFAPVANAGGYLIVVARDPAFRDIVTSVRSDTPRITLATSDDGIHHVKVRAIAATGVEGFDATAAIDVQARPEAPMPATPPDGADVVDDTVNLSWSGSPAASGYRVQLADDPAFVRLRRDLRVTEPRAAVPLEADPSASAPAQMRFWRVATIAADGRRIGPFSQASRLQWRPTPAAPQAGAPDDGVVELRWEGGSGERFDVQVTADPQFASVLHALTVAQPTTRLPRLDAGRWYVRIRRTLMDGYVSPWSPPQVLQIPSLVRTAGGTVIRSGSGLLLESPRP